MRLRKWVLMAGGLAILLVATQTVAHGPRDPDGDKRPGMGMGGMGMMGMGAGMGMGFGPRLAAELNLTADQKKAIGDLHKQLQADMAPLWPQIQAKIGELAALWKVDAPDRNAILAKVSELDSLHEQARAAHIDFGLAAHKLLTPDQRAKAVTLMTAGPMGGHGRHGMGPSADDGACPCAGPGAGTGSGATKP